MARLTNQQYYAYGKEQLNKGILIGKQSANERIISLEARIAELERNELQLLQLAPRSASINDRDKCYNRIAKEADKYAHQLVAISNKIASQQGHKKAKYSYNRAIFLLFVLLELAEIYNETSSVIAESDLLHRLTLFQPYNISKDAITDFFRFAYEHGDEVLQAAIGYVLALAYQKSSNEYSELFDGFQSTHLMGFELKA